MGNAQPKNMRKYASFLQEFVQKTDLIRPELKLNSSLKSQYTRSYKLDKAIPTDNSLSYTPPIAEILCVINPRAIVVCGFLMKSL